MGLFDFLKVFRASEEKSEIPEEAEKIKLDKLSAWVETLSKSKVDGISSDLLDAGKRISEEKEKMEESIRKLEKAELNARGHDERVKSIIEGNRKAYVQKVDSFLREIEPPQTFDESVRFCGSFDKALSYFGKGTIRNYKITHEFFLEDAGTVSASLKSLADIVGKVKKIVKKVDISAIEELKKCVAEILGEVGRRESLWGDIRVAEGKLRESSSRIKEKEKLITELEDGSRYREFAELLEKKKLLEQELNELKSGPLHLFSSVNAALRKYERINPDSIMIGRYVDNWLKALEDDDSFEIVEIAGVVRDCVAKGEVEMKEKKKEKVLQELGRFEKSYFETFLKKYRKFMDNVLNIEQELEKMKIVREIEELKDSVRKDVAMRKSEKIKVEEMKKERSEISIDGLVNALEEKIADATGKKVEIIVG